MRVLIDNIDRQGSKTMMDDDKPRGVVFFFFFFFFLLFHVLSAYAA